ncbi:sensor histidine kinase [Desulfosporosinus shakirovi]|uniref:sensor histidine kinase n=1 Tax=Desulfosporosinus shakirovi TaxID=2885154 RepID=UPI001E5EE8D3|nr:HAMP domain-containing sensor histidine kinase [Desulfosporosinus sp. SRJS8]MCB8815386.1 HAMP domain-containing histidine kinase [Desulfosporosinus sp. SRJS8]
MDKLNSIWEIAAVAAIAAALAIATVAILLERRRMQRIMDQLTIMLDSAMDGDFSEGLFDESTLSALETKMARFLSSSAVSSKNLTKEKNNIKGLISDISHQTKTPISNILLYSQLLSEHELPEDCTLCVKALASQAEKLNFLIGALVKTSRLETGIITINLKKEAVQKLLDAAIAQIKPKSEAKEITVVLDSTDCTAYFDAKWTTEAVYNILDNAVKYSPAQSTINIKATPYELFNRIDITDQGIGVTEEEQSKIFARFYRSAAVSGHEGVGIGLFLAREIISSGGGYLKVSSKLGQGATFSIFLPTEKR